MTTNPARRRCGAPYCPNPAADGSSKCTAHKRELDATYERHRDIYQDPRWLELSAFVLATRPACEQCRDEPARHVDHVIALRDGGAPFDILNVQALGVRCHGRKTARETSLGRPTPAKVRRRPARRPARRRR